MEISGGIDVASMLREQFVTFDAVGHAVGLNPDRQRRVLLVARDAWPDWSRFRDGGPLPAQPVGPIMLRRLAAATHRLACLADPLPAAQA